MTSSLHHTGGKKKTRVCARPWTVANFRDTFMAGFKVFFVVLFVFCAFESMLLCGGPVVCVTIVTQPCKDVRVRACVRSSRVQV